MTATDITARAFIFAAGMFGALILIALRMTWSAPADQTATGCAFAFIALCGSLSCLCAAGLADAAGE